MRSCTYLRGTERCSSGFFLSRSSSMLSRLLERHIGIELFFLRLLLNKLSGANPADFSLGYDCSRSRRGDWTAIYSFTYYFVRALINFKEHFGFISRWMSIDPLQTPVTCGGLKNDFELVFDAVDCSLSLMKRLSLSSWVWIRSISSGFLSS